MDANNKNGSQKEIMTKKKQDYIPAQFVRTHGPGYIPQPKPELPHEGAREPKETLPPAELNADISLSAFFSPQTGQIIDSESALEEKTNSSNTW